MRCTRGLGQLLFALTIFVPVCFAAQPSPLSIASFLEVPTLSSPRLSPDGSTLAYLRTQRSLEHDETTRQLWIARLDDGVLRRITYDTKSPRRIGWRPDGSLCYLARHDNQQQLFINPLDGSEARPVTAFNGNIENYWWSPDGTRLAILATPREETAEAASESAETKADWEVFDRLEHPARYAQMYLVTVKGDQPDETAPRQLTEAPLHPYELAWSPDGTRVALTYNRRFSSLIDEEQCIGLLTLAKGKLEQITPNDRHASRPAFSSGGKRLAFFMDREAAHRTYLNLKDLVVHELRSSDQRVLTAHSPMNLGGSGSTPADRPRWSSDGKMLYLRAARRTTLDLYRVDASSGTIERVTQLAGGMTSFDIVGDLLAYGESELHRPGSLRVRYLGGEARERTIVSTDASVANFALRSPQRLVLPGYDGTEVEGFLFLPPHAEGKGPYPTIIEMHGGPYFRYGNTWTTRYPWHVLSHAGFAVFIANPRGSTGYGQAFRQGNYRNYGTNDYRDLMVALDALISRGTADPERLGFTGYSYGGLMTNTVISRTTRFAAAVSIAGIFNFVSAMGQSNPQLIIDAYDQPWSGDLQRLWEHSPASRAHQIRTPTLVMHGMNDRPVDPRQSIELFSFLQLNSVPSRLVLYPDEGHGINRPTHMLDYETRELDWFRHYLLGADDAEGAQEPVPVEPTRFPVE